MKTLRELDELMQDICIEVDKRRDKGVWTEKDEEGFEAFSMSINQCRVQIDQAEKRLMKRTLALKALVTAQRYHVLFVDLS